MGPYLQQFAVRYEYPVYFTRDLSGSPQSCDAHHEVMASRQRLVARKLWKAEAPVGSNTNALRIATDGPAFSPQCGLHDNAAPSAA